MVAVPEVGIGPDAEVFTKAPVLASVGCGDDIGILSDSAWNNPEPEGRRRQQPLIGERQRREPARHRGPQRPGLLGKAKDNNASCALGPFIRLFDASCWNRCARRRYTCAWRARTAWSCAVINTMTSISRGPTDLVAQTLTAHQYPDGFMLFMGTLSAPIEDRDQPGGGFTTPGRPGVHPERVVPGGLHNRVAHSEAAPPWRLACGLSY